MMNKAASGSGSDVLEDPEGQPLAYMRSRPINDSRDVVLYERDEQGVVRREFEVVGVPWPHSLADIPTKFHSEFRLARVTEYTYEEEPPNPKFLRNCV
jgi:hypothetical protein